MKKLILVSILAALTMSVGRAAESRFCADGERFFVGCNYWASHAGVYMWRNWDGAQVERDFEKLAGCGMTVLRVFPLWPDFQPLTADFGPGQSFHGYSQAGGPLQNDAAVDEEMMRRFRFMCDAAGRKGLKLVVGLITGWMSGRAFVPPALERMPATSDPESIRWQVRFVRHFVREMKDHPAIAAWDLGNECNCLGGGNQAGFWCWMHQIASEIRVCDPSRPVVSGMHGCSSKADARTNVRQQGELMDILTTHPYPLWTPGCNTEPFDTLRNGCHAACETTLYGNLGGKPAFVEEAGSMGPQIVSETRAAASMRMALFSCWAAGLPGYVWWCAFDQDKLAFAPYDWTAIERELGLFTSGGEPKPTAREMGAFAKFVSGLPFKLPPRRVDAVVLMSEVEQTWKQAMGAWLLSRQAGFDISYALAEGPLPESSFYILPSGAGYNTYSRTAFWRVMDKAKAGATVLVTLGNGSILSDLETVAGVHVENHFNRASRQEVVIGDNRFEIADSHTRLFTPVGGEVLAKNAAGEPVMTEFRYGKGKVLFFNGALETNADLAGWPAYRLAAERAGVKRRVVRREPSVGVTEHPRADGSTVVVAVNYRPEPVTCAFTADGKVGEVVRGDVHDGQMKVPGNDAVVFTLLQP